MNSLEKDEMGTAHRSGQIGSLRCGGPYSNADEGNPGEPWNHEKSETSSCKNRRMWGVCVCVYCQCENVRQNSGKFIGLSL